MDRPTRDGDERLRAQTLLSTLIAVLGVVLLIYMIVVEDEPGALPLLLIAVGVGWRLLLRARTRSRPG